jgi:hypothetical protein
MVSTGWGWLVEAEDFWLEYVDAGGDGHVRWSGVSTATR